MNPFQSTYELCISQPDGIAYIRKSNGDIIPLTEDTKHLVLGDYTEEQLDTFINIDNHKIF